MNLLDPKYEVSNSKSSLSMSFSSMYYNPVASFWEPFIERSKLKVSMNEANLELKISHKLNVNISETLIKTLAMTWKSWNEKEPRKSLKETGRHSRKAQGICPFFMKNESGMCIYLLRAKQRNENSIIKPENEDIKEAIVPNGSTMGIVMDYETTIDTLVENGNNNVKMTDTIFQVRFDSELDYSPINGLNLNTVGSGTHYLIKDNKQLNYLVYTITMDNMIKMLTIRTPLKFINKTEYMLKIIFYPKSEQAQEHSLRTGSNFSVPVNLMDEEFMIIKADTESNSEKITPSSLHEHFFRHSTVIPPITLSVK